MNTKINETTLTELVNHIKAGHEIKLEEDGHILATVIPANKSEKIYGRISAMPGIVMTTDFDAPLTGEKAEAFGLLD